MKAEDIVREARRLVVLTGAGVSTESGIPDFRSAGGIWSRFDPEEFHLERFHADPVRFWQMRAKLMEALDLERVEPNAAHVAIARASASPRMLGHVTQNIDGLFAKAGHDPDKLVEIHGSAARVRCTGCLRFFSYSSISLASLPPACPDCGGIVKPGTVLFGEALPEDAMVRATTWMRTADVVLVAGTSLAVQPVASLPSIALDRGARLVLVNDAPTAYDDEAHAVVRERVGVAVPRLLAALTA